MRYMYNAIIVALAAGLTYITNNGLWLFLLLCYEGSND